MSIDLGSADQDCFAKSNKVEMYFCMQEWEEKVMDENFKKILTGQQWQLKLVAYFLYDVAISPCFYWLLQYDCRRYIQ